MSIPTPRFFDNYDAEITNTERWQERRRQVQSQVDSVTPSQAFNMTRLAKMFPVVSPGVIRGLGQAGLGPDDPAAQFAITSELLRNYSTVGQWNGHLGIQQRRGPDSPDQSSSTSSSARKRDPKELLYMGGADSTVKAQYLIKRAETLGVFDPNTKVLVEPEFGSGDEPSEKYRIFTALQDEIYRLSDSPVPYVARDGQIRGYSPATSGIGDPVINLTGDSQIDAEDLSIPGGVDVENVGYSPEVAKHLSSLKAYEGVDLPVNTSGDPRTRTTRLRQTQALNASNIINQVFTNAENETALQSARRQASANVRKSGVGIDLSGGIAPTARAIFTTFDAPAQEIQGQVRNIYGSLHGEDVNWLESQSDLGIILPKLLRGESINQGTGFFTDPESGIARERRQREASRGSIGDHNITVGRIIANTVFEPDTKPFQLVSGLADAGVQLADPTTYGLGTVGDIQKARKFFSHLDEATESAGAFNGLRKTVHGPTFEHWADNNTAIIDKFVETKSAYEIAKLTNFKLDPDITAALARVNRDTGVRQILSGQISKGRILTTTELEGTKMSRLANSWENAHKTLNPRYNPRTNRVFKMMPGQTVDLEDKSQVARQLVRTLENAHAQESDIAEIYNMVSSAKGRNGLFKAVEHAESKVGGLLESYGIADSDIISDLTRFKRSTYNEDLRGTIDEVGADVPVWDEMNINGQVTKITGPHLIMEHTSRYIHLPDPRAVRRLTSRYKGIFAKGIYNEVLGVTGSQRLPFAAMDYIMGNLLKPAWLMRLAWPVRVVGEEQLRMAAGGLDSMFSGHPLSAIATIIGNDETRLARTLDKLTPGLQPRLTISPNGEMFELTEELSKVTYKAHSGWVDKNPGVIRSNVPTVYSRLNEHELADYRHAWAKEIALLHHDPISNMVANTDNLDDVVEWLMSGGGNKFRRELMEAHPGNMVRRSQVEEYVQTISDRIARISGGQTDLIDVIKTGKFKSSRKGEEVAADLFIDAPRLNPEFTVRLKAYDEFGPEKVKGTAAMAARDRDTFTTQLNNATDRIMSILMGVPTSTLSRAPAFKQFVWQRAAQILPLATPEASQTILRNAKKARVPARQMKQLERAAKSSKGTLSADELDTLAKSYAVDDTKNLLYDMSEKSQFADILRNIIPFGEAWKEVLTRWANLATVAGPGGIPLPGKAVRRFQQGITGLRGEDFGDFMGAPEGKGFFYENTFGEEVFAYPGSEWATSSLTGVPVPLTGRVQGLNMFGTIMPGLGPVAQIPVAWFLQDKPDLKWWREQLLPFGGPGAEDTSDILGLRDYLPAWGKTAVDAIFQGGTDTKTYASNVMYVAAYLHSTGEYGDTPEEQQRLLEDAKDRARELYAIRMVGQFSLITSPSFDWMVKDKDGRLLSQRILAEEYLELETEDYDTATEKFLDRYGYEAIGAIIPHSKGVISNVPVTNEGAKWVADHPDIKQDFPYIYGFFTPDEGEFDMQVYQQQFKSGERQALTPREWLNLKDTLMGNYHYNRAKARLGENANSPTDPQQDWLREQKTRILEAYPNWNNTVGLKQRPTSEQMVAQLYEAANNPTIKKTDAGKGLVEYLSYRDAAQAQAEAAGLVSFKSANAMAPTRAWLANHANDIISRHPEFERLWVIVFSREMDKIMVEQELEAAS